MNLQRISHSIITRLLLLGICIVLIGTVIRYFTLTHFLREDLGTVVAAQQLSLANYVAQDVDRKIIERRAFLERLAATLPLDLIEQPERLRAWLLERHELQPLFSYGLFVTGTDGMVLADYPERSGRTKINYADRDYVQAALTGQSYIGRPVIGRIAKEPVLPMAVPVKNTAGEVRAVLAGITALATPGFLDLLQQNKIGDSGGFLLISPRDQLFVASTQPDMALMPTPPAGINALHDRAMAGFRGTGITTNAQGNEELSAMVSVPSTGWFVVARLPTAEAFSTVERVQRYILRNSLVVVSIFLLLASFGLKLVFRPLLQAAELADGMTQDEQPLQPLPVMRNDEVGHLTAAFNRLLMKLGDSQRELARIAHHDALTGLPNRVLLADRLHQALAHAKRQDLWLALLFLDLDDFKPINDSLGHESGDEALRQVAARFSHIVRQADTLARVGGDEFVLLLCGLDGDAEEAARTVAAKCIEAMATPFILNGRNCQLGVSIGVAIGQGDCSSDTLLQLADQAMYRAKEAGRGQYVIAHVAP